MIYPKIVNLIKESSKIAILSHIMPDGDNIGSGLAMSMALNKLGKKATFILDDQIPEIYKFLTGALDIEKPNNLYDYDLIIALDCGDMERLGESSKYIFNKTIINIDHHVSNTSFGTVNLIDKNAAATGEIVYKVICELGVEIDKSIAECIYVAISTDTGHFQYSNTSSATHKVVSDLLQYGINVQKIYRSIYQNNSKQKIALIGEALKSLQFIFRDKVSIVKLTKKQIDDALGKDEDSEGIINIARDIDGVEVAVFLKEIDYDLIKVGFRSKDYVDVSKLAQIFGGGGHMRASGCTIRNEMKKVEEMIIEEIEKVI